MELNIRMNKFYILIISLCLLACGAKEEKVIGEIELLEKAQFEEVIQGDVLLVDVRTPAEYDAGFIPGAVNIDFKQDDFEQRMKHFDKDVPVAVYCAKGGRSAGAAEKLKALGFKKVYDLKGGYTNWNTP